MPEVKYVCTVKCYYLARLWRPAGKERGADVLKTDREDVPSEYFKAVGMRAPGGDAKFKKPPVGAPMKS